MRLPRPLRIAAVAAALVAATVTTAHAFSGQAPDNRWQKAPLPTAGTAFDRGVRMIAPAATDPTIVYAGTSTGLYKTTDAGATYTPLPALGGKVIHALWVDSTDAQTVIAEAWTAGSPLRVLRSSDCGASFAPIATHSGYTLDADLAPGWISQSPYDPDVLIADAQKAGWARLLLSTDRGATWQRLSDPDIWGEEVSGAVWTAPGSVWLSAFHSADNGATWTENTAAAKLSLRVQGGAGAILYGDHGYRSTDSGTTWQKMRGLYFWPDLTVNPSNPSEVYALTDSVLLRSTDAGATWHALYRDTSLDPSDTRLSVDWQTGALTLLGAYSVRHSTDDGATWRVLGLGVPFRADYDLFLASPADPFTVFDLSQKDTSSAYISTLYTLHVGPDTDLPWITKPPVVQFDRWFPQLFVPPQLPRTAVPVEVAVTARDSSGVADVTAERESGSVWGPVPQYWLSMADDGHQGLVLTTLPYGTSTVRAIPSDTIGKVGATSPSRA